MNAECVGMLEYLASWRWGDEGIIHASAGAVFVAKSLPLILHDAGTVEHLATYEHGAAVFISERSASEYIVSFAKHDLQMRGFRDERTAAFMENQQGNLLLWFVVVQHGGMVQVSGLVSIHLFVKSREY